MNTKTNAANPPVDRVFDEENCHTEMLPASSIPDGTDIIFLADDSFFPFYKEGQHIFVRRCDTLRNGEFGAMVLNGKTFMKFYSEEKEETADGELLSRIVLKSVNPDIPPVYIKPEDEFGIIGKVIA